MSETLNEHNSPYRKNSKISISNSQKIVVSTLIKEHNDLNVWKWFQQISDRIANSLMQVLEDVYAKL